MYVLRIEQEAAGVKFYERVIPPIEGKGKPFLLMETQVTQALYKAVMGTNPSWFNGDRSLPDLSREYGVDLQRPVEWVSWEDGVRFANALSKELGLQPAYQGSDNDAEIIEGANGFHLPLEAEWEWAAKGGGNHEYAGSDKLDEVAWHSGNSDAKTHPVGEKQANAYGLRDMSGNVHEWVADDYDNPGQYRPGAVRRVVRGGSWGSDADCCQVSFRGGGSPRGRRFVLGLRLSRPLD